MPTTYKPINSKAELEQALESLFEGKDLEWVNKYFDGKPETGFFADSRHVAFQDGMDELLRGMFSENSGKSLNIVTYPNYVGDGRLDLGELREILAADDLSALKLREVMGEELYIRFESVATGLINGIIDKEKRKDTYSIAELQEVLGDYYLKHLYLDGRNPSTFFEAVRAMNASCGSFQETMTDAYSHDNLQPLPSITSINSSKELSRG